MTFDPLKIANEEPQSVAITYRGKTYLYNCCGTCERWFWRDISDRSLRHNTRVRVYCSPECRMASTRSLQRARQERWRKNYLLKHGKPYRHEAR